MTRPRWSPTLGIAALATLLGVHTDRVVRRVNRTPPAGTIVDLDLGGVHVLSGGVTGPGRPVVLIHGSDGVVNDWPLSGFLDRVAARHEVLAHDRPGHGHTPVPRGEDVTFDLNVRVLRDLLCGRDYTGKRAPVLVGHSYGAAVALSYARAYPDEVAGLVLISPTAFPKTSLEQPLAHLMHVPGLRQLLMRVLLLPVGQILVRVEGGRAFYPAPMPDSWKRMMLKMSRRPSQASALARENSNIGHELRELSRHYGEITVPTVVIGGRHDLLTPHDEHAAPLAGALGRARLVTVEGGGHQLHWTHPDVVLRAVAELVDAPLADSQEVA